MSAKERKAFKVIYGVARAQEEIYEIMAELLLCHGIDGVTEKSFKASGVTVKEEGNISYSIIVYYIS